MTTEILAERRRGVAPRQWGLELDAELPPGAAASAGSTAVLTGLLARTSGVGAVAVEPHCGNRFVLVSLTVEARDPSDAVDRGVALLRSSASAAGLGRLVLVGARSPRS